ncbi:MAG TPA: hypothetical protein VFV52_12935 [Bacilli bacterium]|nr:hypothetical protein [Bacilli bacterium]
MAEEAPRRKKLMAKPIAATPILRGQDLVDFVEDMLSKRQTPENVAALDKAADMLRKALRVE